MHSRYRQRIRVSAVMSETCRAEWMAEMRSKRCGVRRQMVSLIDTGRIIPLYRNKRRCQILSQRERYRSERRHGKNQVWSGIRGAREEMGGRKELTLSVSQSGQPRAHRDKYRILLEHRKTLANPEQNEQLNRKSRLTVYSLFQSINKRIASIIVL